MDIVDQGTLSFWQEIDQQQQTIENARAKLSSIQTALDNIHNQLRNNPNEDVRNLEERLDTEESSIRNLTLQEGENRQKIVDRESEVEKLSQQIKKLQLSEAKQAKIQRQIAATEDAINRLQQIQSNMDQVFRTDLEKQVQKIFNGITTVPYLPRLTEKYELTLIEKTTGQERSVAASTGENQVLSLAFIAAIIQRVWRWSQKSANMEGQKTGENTALLMGPDSGSFPIVMDSPFGSLDKLYRRQVSRALPKLVNQLVVLVSPTQWQGEVEEELKPYIGKQYVLVYNSPKPEVQQDQIHLYGEVYPLVKLSPNEFDYTEILEVPHGN
ncbi:MAG: ATP-binding protein, partial [Prochlorotrichaceae cyanobacterium]